MLEVADGQRGDSVNLPFQLPPGAAVISVGSRSLGVRRSLGGQAHARAVVTVRCAEADGRVVRLRRRVDCAGLSLAVTGWLRDQDVLWVALGTRAEELGPITLADRFRVPLRLHQAGGGSIPDLQVALRGRCRGGRDLFRFHGSLAVTVGADTIRVDFCRVVEAAGALPWEGWAGVTALRLAAGPNGLEGEAEICIAARRWTPAPEPVQPAHVREAVGVVEQVSGEVVVPDTVLISGTLMVDLFWFDADGKSRWAGRPTPFTALLRLAGAQPDHKLELEASVLSVVHQVTADHVLVTAVVAVRCKAISREGVGGWLLERVVGSATAETQATVSFSKATSRGQEGSRSVSKGIAALEAVDTQRSCTGGADPDGVRRIVDQPGGTAAWGAVSETPGGGGRPSPWRQVAVELGPPQADARGGWRASLAVKLDGRPHRTVATGLLPEPPPSGSRLFAGLVSLSAAEVVTAAVVWPGAGRPSSAVQRLEALLRLPCPVRAVLGASARPVPGALLIEALVRPACGGLQYVAGKVAAPRGRPVAMVAAANGTLLTAVVELSGDG